MCSILQHNPATQEILAELQGKTRHDVWTLMIPRLRLTCKKLLACRIPNLPVLQYNDMILLARSKVLLTVPRKTHN